MFIAAAGITAVFMAVPLAYESLRWIGAAYLLWLAWQASGPAPQAHHWNRARSPQTRHPSCLPDGFLTNALNPKIAVFYLSVFPQFVRPEHGSMFAQSIELGLVQIAVSFCVNLALILSPPAWQPGLQKTRSGSPCSGGSWASFWPAWRFGWHSRSGVTSRRN